VELFELKPSCGALKRRKRVGRGVGSGHGVTSCRGKKGQLARSGGGKGPLFEGGQTPLHRRIPKIGGFKPINKKEFSIVNLKDLNKIQEKEINPEVLIKNKIIKKIKDGVKILGEGEITKPFIISGCYLSKSAEEKIKKVGGEIIPIKEER
jgi:large subunit ribosomal protein L15